MNIKLVLFTIIVRPFSKIDILFENEWDLVWANRGVQKFAIENAAEKNKPDNLQ